MKPFLFLLAGLLGNAVADHNQSSPYATHQRFSVLEHRARELDKSMALAKRNDFTCGPGKPCKNGAYCGKDGWCGYGPTYCGTGCTSNCDAHAECGRDAFPVNKTCPLNTCCSEFGFCGTTRDFCTGKCQSNCVEHPKPPGGGKGGKILSRVIGYYEAWNDRSLCYQTTTDDLPVNGLTHPNYAFAFIDLTTFKITTMDTATPFLNTYRYDGVDIDWEYPGAPDRSGKPDDTKNYVLIEMLRKTFRNSGRKLGITFTAPSGMIKYVDRINVMRYDLYGVWNGSNPIGPIVQAHTNLAEIKLATELSWRAKIPPSKLALGFGFHGRAFTLRGLGCSRPGRQFSSGAKPGVCTGNDDGFESDSEDLAEGLPKKPVEVCPGEPRKSTLVMGERTLVWFSRPYPTSDKRKYLFRPGIGLATMLVKGSFDKASQVYTNPGLIYTQMSDMAQGGGFHTEHLLELQLPKLLLRTAYTGELPKMNKPGQLPRLNKRAPAQLIKAARITGENLFTGWHKPYPSNINLNPFYEVVDWKDLPEDYLPPPNTPAGRVMTALGDWGNMQNLAVARGEINLMKGRLSKLFDPIVDRRFKALVKKALKNDEEAAKEIEEALQQIFLVFAYLNDAGLEPLWRQEYEGFNQEVINMDLYMPELKGIKAIWDEFWPVYQDLVAQRAADWVLHAYNSIVNGVTPEMAAQGGPLGKPMRTAKHYSQMRNRLSWNRD